MSETVFLDAPVLGEPEKLLLCRAIDEGFVSTAGPFVPEFEARFAARLGTGGAAAVQSGTAALELALGECGIGPGDEVVVPDLTFAATVNAVARVGARVVLADVDPATWTLDPEEVVRVSGPRTRAIMPVHLYGVPCRMDALAAVAGTLGARIVEDATEALDASFAGRAVGTIGDFGAFSFNGNKAITTGGGGMLVGRERERIDHARFLANQARDERLGYFHPEVGCNYRMTNIEAAMGLAQLGRIDALQGARKAFGEIWRRELADVPGLQFQDVPAGGVSSHWMTAVLLPEGRDPETVRVTLASCGVQTRRLFHPLSDMPPWRGRAPRPTPVTAALFRRGLCLPSSPRNSVDAVLRACDELRKALA